MNTTQQDSHGEDELPLDRIARFTDDYIECWQDDNTTDQDLRDLQDDLRNYFEQLAIRRAVAELEAMIAQWEYPSLAPNWCHERLTELTAELKGHAK